MAYLSFDDAMKLVSTRERPLPMRFATPPAKGAEASSMELRLGGQDADEGRARREAREAERQRLAAALRESLDKKFKDTIIGCTARCVYRICCASNTSTEAQRAAQLDDVDDARCTISDATSLCLVDEGCRTRDDVWSLHLVAVLALPTVAATEVWEAKRRNEAFKEGLRIRRDLATLAIGLVIFGLVICGGVIFPWDDL